MSIVLVGSTSGSCTLQEQAVAGNTVLTLPTTSGTIITTASTGGVSQSMLASGVAGNGPAFSAFMGNNQSITNGVWTKANFNSEQFDTANCYDPTTNYRFTPNVAGYYQVNLAVAISAASNVSGFGIAVYGNGIPIQYFYRAANSVNGTTDAYPSGSFLVYCNGTTDYLEAYGYAAGTTPSLIAISTQSCFQAFLVRAA